MMRWNTRGAFMIEFCAMVSFGSRAIQGGESAPPERTRVRARPIVLAALAALAAASMLWGGAGRAEAQERTAPQPPVIELEEDFVIEGHVRKPEAFYFLRRTPFGFVIRTLDEDFLHEVVRSVGAEPF